MLYCYRGNKIFVLICLDFKNSEVQRENWERNRQTTEQEPVEHHRKRRSISKERYVETLVVLDPTLNKYYENEDIELYILTVMNMVCKRIY